jgi:hypothetical protein
MLRWLKKKRTATREERAVAGADKIREALQIAYLDAGSDETIVRILLANSEVYELVFDLNASSLSLPQMKHKGRVILGYEWDLLEVTDESAIASKILMSVREKLKSGKLSSKVEDYQLPSAK